jgi:hypothetical protein
MIKNKGFNFIELIINGSENKRTSKFLNQMAHKVSPSSHSSPSPSIINELYYPS